jgi:hypothetical protein
MHISRSPSSHLQRVLDSASVAHSKDSSVYAPLDNLSLANNEAQWRAAVVACIEFRAISLERAPVVDIDLVSPLRLALALDGSGNLNIQLRVGSEDGGGSRS